MWTRSNERCSKRSETLEAADHDLIVAPGFSYRHQITDFCDDPRSVHTAELLAKAG